ncbi:single-stranded DNA-binding protein 2 [Gottschalkia purinilytica]|uniref:Single-stranded DNA-binding protein n=1 Tax=Gottschalkia purinilytica TaxID=1503 RepID=A0A0L0W6R1_GOTPU|nr:single-stranded DNA-binding protein [Gottschalkia purinilytica]KNF06950.1 single-stranded DNA-binding protein 2 [Gottschalkia purinilytica]
MNNVTLIGRLTRDPELKYLPNGGLAVSNFSVAVDKELSKDKKQELESKGQPTADFINIVVWGKQGEHCANYLGKGRLVAIQGRIQSRSYEATDGSKRYVTEVVAERVKFLDWGDKEKNNDFNTDGFHPVDDDDIPF